MATIIFFTYKNKQKLVYTVFVLIILFVLCLHTIGLYHIYSRNIKLIHLIQYFLINIIILNNYYFWISSLIINSLINSMNLSRLLIIIVASLI